MSDPESYFLYDGIMEPGPQAAAAFDLAALDRDFYENPYPFFHALRRHAPVKRLADGSWFLTRYSDLDAIYHDPALFSSDKTVEFQRSMGDTPLYEHHTASLVFNDPPRHSFVRRRLAPAFTPRALRALESRVRKVVTTTLDRISDLQEFDLLHDFAMTLPIELIGDMLGIPQADRHRLSPWAVAILSGLEADLSPEGLASGSDAVEEFKAYLCWLIAERGRNPLPDDSGEVLSRLIGPDRNGAVLPELDLLHNCIFLLNAGHETTANTITNGIDALLRFPDQCEKLRKDPDLIDSTVEELLRFESVVQLNNRKLTADTTINNVTLRCGDYVWMAVGAANRDPAVFADPDRLDVSRRPNRHLAFAAGIHACAGLSLARMEVRVAVGEFVRRFGNIEPTGQPVHHPRARFRGFITYPVRIT